MTSAVLRRFALSAAVLAVVLTAPAGAQRPLVTAAALADSLRALNSLSPAVQANPGDTTAWLRRADIATRLVQLSEARLLPRGLDEQRTFRIAHESFNRALALAPEDSRVYVGLARLKFVGGGVQGQSAIDLQCEAFRYARSRRDSVDFAAAGMQMGRAAWSEYAGFAERAVSAFIEERAEDMLEIDLRGQRGQAPPDYSQGAFGPIRPAETAAAGSVPGRAAPNSVSGAAGRHVMAPLPVLLAQARDTVLRVMSPMSFDASGERQYLLADQWFERAYRALPEALDAFLLYAKVLVARNRWSELESIAVARTAQLPSRCRFRLCDSAVTQIRSTCCLL